MKWNETVRAIAESVESAHVLTAPPPAGWDPYDVWLNRVHEPRTARAQQSTLPGIRRVGDFRPAATPTT